MNECSGCGSYVTVDFARVFGTNRNEVFACPRCATMSEIKEFGAAAGADVAGVT